MEEGASSWLSNLPIKAIGYALNQGFLTWGTCIPRGIFREGYSYFQVFELIKFY